MPLSDAGPEIAYSPLVVVCLGFTNAMSSPPHTAPALRLCRTRSEKPRGEIVEVKFGGPDVSRYGYNS
jgi:hypothetical protein